MLTIKDNYNKINEGILKALSHTLGDKRDIKIIAITKYVDINIIKEFLSLNLSYDLGENRVNALKEKANLLDKNINWHFIGRIQTNKLKTIVKYSSLIQSVSNTRSIDIIDKVSLDLNKKSKILLQINISGEEQKDGVAVSEVDSMLDYISSKDNIEVTGFMGMATRTDDKKIIEKEFESIHRLLEINKDKYKNLPLKELSIGMSSDYIEAVKHGATMVRIGQSIFG